MKYICLKCKTVRNKTPFEKTYKKILEAGKTKKVPVCCGQKMSVLPKEV